MVPWTLVGRWSVAPVSSAVPKTKSFHRGGPVWPPRSNVTNDCSKGGSVGALPPQPKPGWSGGQRPPAKIEKLSKYFRFWLGALPPRPPGFWLGGQSPPRPPPLNGRSSHLIEAAKRGRLDQMIFFSAPLTAADDTRAARTSGWMPGRTPGRTPDVSTRRRVQRTNLKPKIKNPNPP